MGAVVCVAVVEGVESVEGGELSVVSIDDGTDASSFEGVLDVVVVDDGEGRRTTIDKDASVGRSRLAAVVCVVVESVEGGELSVVSIDNGTNASSFEGVLDVVDEEG